MHNQYSFHNPGDHPMPAHTPVISSCLFDIWADLNRIELLIKVFDPSFTGSAGPRPDAGIFVSSFPAIDPGEKIVVRAYMKVMIAAASCISSENAAAASWLIMIFQESNHLTLKIQVGIKVFSHRFGMPFPEPVIQTFIISIIKPLLLQCPLHFPVHFGHKLKTRIMLLYRFYCFWPKGFTSKPPCFLKNFRQHKHCHITSDSIALS